MRSSSEAEPSNSLEHAMLDAIEARQFGSSETGARLDLLVESEKNMRNGLFPELYPRRFRNMEHLFDLFRSSRSLPEQTLWQEARLLRLMERYEQCRQLCQGHPMYEWSFPALQEFIWAGRRDSFAYPRLTEFENEEDAAHAGQLFAAAKTLYESKCYQWQQAHDEEAKPNAYEQRVTWRNTIVAVMMLASGGAGWYFFGWIAAIVAFFGGGLLLDWSGDEDELIKKRMTRWCRENPRPKMRLKLTHTRPGVVGGGFPDIA
jgi:hypothetical protein